VGLDELDRKSAAGECGAGARLGHSRPDIVLIHYAKLLDESAVAAAATVSSKLSARSAELEAAGLKPIGSQTAASFFACAC
jgi:hypothetical protein